MELRSAKENYSTTLWQSLVGSVIEDINLQVEMSQLTGRNDRSCKVSAFFS